MNDMTPDGTPDAEEAQECVVQNAGQTQSPVAQASKDAPQSGKEMPDEAATSSTQTADASEAEAQASNDADNGDTKSNEQGEEKRKKRRFGARAKGFVEGLFHGHPETDWEQRYEEYQHSQPYQAALKGARSQKELQGSAASAGTKGQGSAKDNGNKGKEKSSSGKGKSSAKSSGPTSGAGSGKGSGQAYGKSSGNTYGSVWGHGSAYGTSGSGKHTKPAYYIPVKTRALPLPGYGPVVGLVSPSKVPVKDFAEAIERAGGTALRIPLVADRRRLQVLYQACDALLFPGGRDVDPRRYGQTEDPACKTQNPDVPRDGSELQLLEWAIEDGMPFLGICRGLQVINVGLEGTLWQDLKEQGVTNKPHKGASWPAHDANIVPESTLGRIVGVDCVRVNSLHHQAVKDLGKGLTVSATSPDGIVEGIELQGHPFGIAVQFHPELMADYKQWAHDIFDRLVVEAERYRASEAPRITRTFPADEIQMWRAATPSDPPRVPRAGAARSMQEKKENSGAETQAPQEKTGAGAQTSAREKRDGAIGAWERAAMRGDLPDPTGDGNAQIVRDGQNHPHIVGRRRGRPESAPAVERNDGVGR